MKFLIELNESYKDIKAQALLIKHFLRLNEVHSTMQQEEKHKERLWSISRNRALSFIIR